VKRPIWFCLSDSEVLNGGQSASDPILLKCITSYLVHINAHTHTHTHTHTYTHYTRTHTWKTLRSTHEHTHTHTHTIHAHPLHAALRNITMKLWQHDRNLYLSVGWPMLVFNRQSTRMMPAVSGDVLSLIMWVCLCEGVCLIMWLNFHPWFLTLEYLTCYAICLIYY
jgi:hypothetical protein